MQPGEVADRIAPAQGRRADAAQAADVVAEAIAPGAVQAGRRIGAGTRAVEQRHHPVVKDVQECDQRAIAVVTRTLARILGHVQRQRAVRAEQASEIDRQARPRALRGRPHPGQCVRFETQ